MLTISKFSDEIEAEIESLRKKAREVHVALMQAIQSHSTAAAQNPKGAEADLFRRLNQQQDRIDVAIDVLDWTLGKPLKAPSAWSVAKLSEVAQHRQGGSHVDE